MNRKWIILVTALVLPILVLGGCGKRGALKHRNEAGSHGGSSMPSARGAARTQPRVPITAPVMPGEVLPDPDPFESRQ